jgi:CRP/FNR family cyclic AMP-dependent transcriptional regulator
MKMDGLETILRQHPFFEDLDEDHLDLVSGCAKNVVFQAGNYLFHEGAAADQFYLLRHGRVALEITAPGRGALTFETLNAGEMVGVSWLFPPYRWTYDAKALELTRAISLDAACLRGKCEEDHSLGYDLMKRFVPVVIERLHATQMQILDVYGSSS